MQKLNFHFQIIHLRSLKMQRIFFFIFISGTFFHQIPFINNFNRFLSVCLFVLNSLFFSILSKFSVDYLIIIIVVVVMTQASTLLMIKINVFFSLFFQNSLIHSNRKKTLSLVQDYRLNFHLHYK